MPIVAVRTGAASVGSLGSALYQQAGLIEVPTVNALLHTLRVMATQPHPRGPNIAVLTNSRSPGTLARAAIESVGLVAVDGPIALDWRSRPDDFRVAIRAALDDETVHGVLVIHAPAVADDVDSTAEDIHEVALGATKPVVAVMLGRVDGPILAGSDVPAFAFPEQAAAVLGRAYAYGQWLETQAEAGPDPTRAVDPEATRLAIDEIVGAGRGSADLREQRRMLEAYGIAFARARVTPRRPPRCSAADEIGYPVAIKATRRRPGRSVRSGVALDVTSAADVDEVVAMMVEAIGSDADHLVVQAMTTPGVDLRIHCEHDERLGVIVSVGLGGAQADVIADRTSRLAPVSPSVASTMLDETRIRRCSGRHRPVAGGRCDRPGRPAGIGPWSHPRARPQPGDRLRRRRGRHRRGDSAEPGRRHRPTVAQAALTRRRVPAHPPPPPDPMRTLAGVTVGIIVPLIIIPIAVIAAYLWYRRKMIAMRLDTEARDVPGARLTSETLRRLPNPPWRVVYEIRPDQLEGADHVVIGPCGIIAMTTVVANRSNADVPRVSDARRGDEPRPRRRRRALRAGRRSLRPGREGVLGNAAA